MKSQSQPTRAGRRRLTAGVAALALTSAAVLGGSVAADAATGASFGPAAASAASQGVPSLTVKSGDTVYITRTTRLSALTIQNGGALAAQDGYTLTLTVNGVETGQRLADYKALTTSIQPGTYRGDVVVTVTKTNAVQFNLLDYEFRQALYVDANGVDASKSVLAAVNGKAGATEADNVKIDSTGEAFNGIYVLDADYKLIAPRITFVGNGRSDFAGMGAAITGSGTSTRLIVDGAHISDTGAVRPAIVATDGANVIVKNSTIHTADGTLPSGYQASVDLSSMESAPWMLGISGTNRSTNLLGENTQATYIGSSIVSENWGALSVDSGQNQKLTAIDSHVANSGIDGYGTYIIGNAHEQMLGTDFDVKSYATIVTGGDIHYGDSTKSAVAALNSSLNLGLTAAELAKLPVKATTIDSARFGVMWHGDGTVAVDGHTSIDTKETTFLDKAQQIGITFDGSQGATVKSGNGVLLQMMENDDPGPVFPSMLNTGVYTEPTTAVAKNSSFDVTAVHSTDATATFTKTKLVGDFFNGMRGDIGGMGPAQPRNLVLTLDGTSLQGVVSASTTKHRVDTITSANYRELGVVSNSVSSVVNNGVIVSLKGGSVWTVTGTSYLSSLTVDAISKLAGANGKKVVVTVNGTQVTPVAGQTYAGDIKVSLG